MVYRTPVWIVKPFFGLSKWIKYWDTTLYAMLISMTRKVIGGEIN